MTKNELKRIIVSAKRHSLYQLFWVALFFPIAIIVLIMSYIIYRKDISTKNLLEMLKRFMKWLKSVWLIQTSTRTEKGGRLGLFFPTPTLFPWWAFLCFINRLNFNGFRYVRQLFATSRTFAIVGRNNLVRRFQLLPFVKNSTTLVTSHLLRHNLTAMRTLSKSEKIGVKEKTEAK